MTLRGNEVTLKRPKTAFILLTSKNKQLRNFTEDGIKARNKHTFF